MKLKTIYWTCKYFIFIYQIFMWDNFIKEFLNNELQKKENKHEKDTWIKKENTNNENKIKHQEQKVIQNKKLKENSINIKKNIDIWKVDKTDSQIQEIENLTKKEITGYLDNNNNLDKSLLQMDNNKELENINNEMEKWVDTNIKWIKEIKSKKVKFKKNKSSKNLHWIIAEFIIWVILIFIAMAHINSNLAELKFMRSSVQLWSNTFQNIVAKLWWVFSDDVEKNYIQKRTKMVEQLSNLEKEINTWCNIKDYKELNYKIESFKNSLLDTNFTPLSKFIKNYDQYNLYLYSLQELVKRKCKKDTNKNSK